MILTLAKVIKYGRFEASMFASYDFIIYVDFHKF